MSSKPSGRAKKPRAKKSAKKSDTSKKPRQRERREGAGREGAGRARRPRRSDAERATPASLHVVMAKLADAQLSSAAPKGACLVADPKTGEVHCTLATPDFCKSTLKGTFIGGPCGGG